MWINNVQIAIFVQLVGILVLIVDKNNLTWTKMSVRGQKNGLMWTKNGLMWTTHESYYIANYYRIFGFIKSQDVAKFGFSYH